VFFYLSLYKGFFLQTHIYPSPSEWSTLLKRPTFNPLELQKTVLDILENVKADGDKELFRLCEKFDGVKLTDLVVSQQEIAEAHTLVAAELKEAILLAKDNIYRFHKSQEEAIQKVETMEGVVCWRENRAITKVGLYIPGGTAPLFSTVLMLGVPAMIAGCEEIVLCTPPNKEGKVHPAILYTADSIGIKKIVKVGGAQAIAAMTYGTESVPNVYKIFGPGNQFVTAAKQLVTQEGVAIDMPAGPSEVAVVADQDADPAFVASDLLSQAEHGADSQVILMTLSEEKVKEVAEALEKQLAVLPRKEFAQKALANSKSFVLKDMDELIAMVNEYGAEHLILNVSDYKSLIPKIKTAGSVFLGAFTPESAGDYASGTNHTLPTNGYAKTYSGVSLDSFIKKITFQEISAKGIQNIGPSIETMAAAEELEAHKNAVTLRLKSIS